MLCYYIKPVGLFPEITSAASPGQIRLRHDTSSLSYWCHRFHIARRDVLMHVQGLFRIAQNPDRRAQHLPTVM